MDQTQEQMKFLGTLGIFAQSFKTIFNSKKLFAGFTFTLAFPLALIFILHMDISSRFFYGIEENPYLLIIGAFQSYRSYYQVDVTHTVWLNYVLFKMIIITNIIIFSTLSTSVIVYTIASLYTGRDITFTKAFKVGNSAWRRLIITLLSMFLTLFAYNLLFSVVVFIFNAISEEDAHMSIILIIISVPYAYWSLYLLTIWEIASVVSVLEDSCGLKAAIKSMDLMNGKKKVALRVSFMLYLFMGVVVFVYMTFYTYNNGALGKVWLGIITIICGVMLVIGFLVIIIVQTMLYLVCKSHHQETIDLGSSSTYLDAYLSDAHPGYRAREVIQLGRPQNQAMAQV
ncbi:hypothetical protein CTI12_AA172860 [Artemisia annua]|uniref:Uncharacterized protein n=1 Tax=Artemisia annua TaxID=35608 RepID=A0A2U1PC50_ARTAN|nr:hypothetical protein CTI12_AA172860 [Artemisia annua]